MICPGCYGDIRPWGACQCEYRQLAQLVIEQAALIKRLKRIIDTNLQHLALVDGNIARTNENCYSAETIENKDSR